MSSRSRTGVQVCTNTLLINDTAAADYCQAHDQLDALGKLQLVLRVCIVLAAHRWRFFAPEIYHLMDKAH